MRSSSDITANLADMIRGIYKRPQMYSPASCIESVLWTCHNQWSFIHETERQFNILWRSMLSRERAATGLWRRFVHDHPDATEDEVLTYVVEKWKTVSAELDVPLEEG